MKKFVHFAAVVAALALAAACTREVKLQTETWTDQAEVPLGQGVDASFTYSASVEYVTGGVSKSVADKINGFIVAHIFDKDGGSDVAEAGARAREEAIEGYRSDVQDYFDTMRESQTDPAEHAWMFNWSSEVEGNFGTTCKERGLQTYVVSCSDYTGGAHGLFATTCYVLNLKNGALVEEKDLFVDGYGRMLSDLLYKHRMDDMDEITGETDPDDIFYAEIGPNGNFAVSQEGVTYYYAPYEIAPYVFGIITIPVPWEELKPILRR